MIGQEHSIFASNDFEIDKVAPSENEHIAEVALQDDQNVSKYQSTFLFSSRPVVDDYAPAAHAPMFMEIMGPSHAGSGTWMPQGLLQGV